MNPTLSCKTSKEILRFPVTNPRKEYHYIIIFDPEDFAVSDINRKEISVSLVPHSRDNPIHALQVL